jgi:hypothetical protein
VWGTRKTSRWNQSFLVGDCFVFDGTERCMWKQFVLAALLREAISGLDTISRYQHDNVKVNKKPSLIPNPGLENWVI